MKAAVIGGPGQLEIRDVPDLPPLHEYQLRCRNLWFSSCTGTDRKLISGHMPWGPVSFPAVLGHETVGEVVEIGPKVRNFQVGDLALRPVYGYAGSQVNGLFCEFGGFSETGVVTDFQAMEADGRHDYSPYCRFQMKIPGAWRDRPESVIFITMKETFSFMRAFGSLCGKKVAVIGVGAVGMFYLKWASLHAPARLTAFASGPTGEARAKRMGADELLTLDPDRLPDERYDLVIDSAGVMDFIDKLKGLVRPGGTYATYGIGATMNCAFQGFGSGIVFDFHSPAESDPEIHELCIRLVERKTIDLAEFHSGIFPFAAMPEAFAAIARKEEFKPVFTP